jgi:hypothetical protein
MPDEPDGGEARSWANADGDRPVRWSLSAGILWIEPWID